MKENNVHSDGQHVRPEEMKQMKEELRRMKRENRLLAIRLRTQEKGKADVAAKMRRLAAIAQQVGDVRILDAGSIGAEERERYLGLAQCAALCGTTYATMIKWLQKEGILVYGQDVWVVGDDYRHSGLFVYMNGVRGSYTRLYLKVAPAGVPFIREVLERHPRRRPANRNTRK